MKGALTPPNIISFFRLVSSLPIYLFITEEIWKIAAAIFFFSCLSDILDGMIARKFNHETPFGARLDHVSDAVLATATIAALGSKGVMPCLLGVLVPIAFLQYFFDSGDPRGSNMVPNRLGKMNGIGYLLICGASLIWLTADKPILGKETFLLLGYFLCVTTVLSMLVRLYLFIIRE